MNACVKKALFLSMILFPAQGVIAQTGDNGGAEQQQDYRQMLQQAMKSGNYSQAQSENWDARLKVVSGTVMVKTVEGEEWSKITGEMPMDPNDVVKTSADGVAELYLDDKGAIAIGRNTELEISSLDQGDTIFSINFGSIAAKIKHFLNDKFKMQVRTPSAVCAVRGTEFAVEYSQLGKDSSVAVFDEGRMAVTQADASGKDNQEYILEKNTEIYFGQSQRRFHPTPISKMGRYRGAVGTMRTRLAAIKNWKPRSLERRAALRAQALKRKVVRREITDDGQTDPKAARAARAKARVKAKAKAAAAKRARARRRAQPDEETEEGQ